MKRFIFIGLLVAACAAPTTAYEPNKIQRTYPPELFEPVRLTYKKPEPLKEKITPVPPTPSPTPLTAKGYARSRLSEAQFQCLVKLWNKESGWNHLVRNRSSGAYGIPQALPAEKMRSAGADWKTNPITQVKWGLKYISGRYGSACNAWSFWRRNGWY